MKTKEPRKKTKTGRPAKDKAAQEGKNRPKQVKGAKPELDIHSDIPSRFEKQTHQWIEGLPKGTWRS